MLEDIRLAFQGIWSHKLRSALTMLGIIIGIGSIIAIVSTIKGTNEQIKKNLVGAGNNAVNIQLYQGDWTLDLSYQEVPDGIPEIRYLVRSRHWMRWKVQPFITDGMNMMLYMQAVRSWQAVIFLE